MAEHAVQRFERIDGLVNDADTTRNRPAEWQRSLLKGAGAVSPEQHPHDRVGTALLLRSDPASFFSGQTIVVDRSNIIGQFPPTEAPWPR